MGNYCFDRKSLDMDDRIRSGQSTADIIKPCFSKLREKNEPLRALKITKKTELSRRKCTQMSINELDVLSRINHPYLVNMVAAFQDISHLYILLEYMPYGSLRDYLYFQKSLNERHSRFAIICILTALECLHKIGIVHLDLKPENVLIDEKLYFRLCDFNLSRQLSESSKKKDRLIGIGTYGYQAPEICAGSEPVGFEADFYSLGVVCLQLLTGQNKKYCESRSAKNLKNTLHSMKILSDNCIDFILRLLEADPKKRLGYAGLSEIWGHPWLCLSANEKKQFENKLGSSPVDAAYIQKFSRAEVVEDGLDVETQFQQDEYIKKLQVSRYNFQKPFLQFKTVCNS